MAFRQMRRINQQLDRCECEEILRNQPRGVLSLLGDDGYPYGIPLDFVYDEGTIYFHSATQGHKLDAIEACDKASFCVLDDGTPVEGEWWYVFRSVIAFGRMRRVTDTDAKNSALRILAKKYFPPTSDIDAEIAHAGNRVLVLALDIEHLSGKRVTEK